MPTGAIWTPTEEAAFVDFLVDNRAEAGDGGNFKTVTYQRVVARLAPLHEWGAVKTVKTCRNKWTTFRRLYRVIRAIQQVSGWVWDDATGASITVHSTSSWDDYVKKHPDAKPFRNKGWPHLHKVALLMPSTSTGANVFQPTATVDDVNEAPDFDHHYSPPAPSSEAATPTSDIDADEDDKDVASVPPSIATKRSRREAATPSHSEAKCIRTSHGATALQNMSESLAGFGSALTAALAGPSTSGVLPTPVRLTNTAVTALLRLENDWLDISDQVKLIDFLRLDITAAGTYTALENQAEVRKKWLEMQLVKLG